VGVPAAAGKLEETERGATRLGGARGAKIGFTYRYKGRANRQLDVVARRGSTVVFVEINVDPAIGEAGLGPWRTLLSSWRWHR
jgi:hypothetical protein